MKHDLTVRSTVIDWPDKTLEITDTSGNKHIVPLSQQIRVTMVGYPAREEKAMLAGDLGRYMERGYIIERIVFETEGSEK